MQSSMQFDNNRRRWAIRVGQVFDTSPRLGYTSGSVWLPREIENRFAELLETKGLHVCLDGATGTGKSSVALTMLNKLEIKHILIQVTAAMVWSDFCKMLVDPESNAELTFDAELEAGIQQGLPLGKFRVKFGGRHQASGKRDFVNDTAKTWSEHDVCEQMAKQGILLLIDDFDRASEEMVRRIAAMCKLLTQSYQKQYAKIVVVGTDDIYRRLYDVDSSLENRLVELSLGTFPNKNASWAFLKMGFEALKLTNPATDKHVSDEERKQCIQAVYEAADGLPKSLNELGREISRRGLGGNRISPADIKEVASQMPINNLKQYRRKEFPQIIKCVESDPAARFILQLLYKRGVGHIHHWSDLVTESNGTYTENQLDNAIVELIEVKFLTRTGRYGEVLFTSNPTLAHTLGVLVSNPEKYNLPSSLYGENGQLKLDLFAKS